MRVGEWVGRLSPTGKKSIKLPTRYRRSVRVLALPIPTAGSRTPSNALAAPAAEQNPTRQPQQQQKQKSTADGSGGNVARRELVCHSNQLKPHATHTHTKGKSCQKKFAHAAEVLSHAFADGGVLQRTIAEARQAKQHILPEQTITQSESRGRGYVRTKKPPVWTNVMESITQKFQLNSD